MRSSLPAVALLLLASTLPATSAEVAGQQARTGSVLEHTLVPHGRARAQLGLVFSSWNRRFGLAPDGTEELEPIGRDLTDPTSLSLFPGMPALQGAVRDATGLSAWDPVLGATSTRIKHDVTTIDFGLHVGVFDWLTVGGVLPWVETRTVVDQLFVPDTVAGNLGVSPTVFNASGVELFLASASGADVAAGERATSICAGGPSAACTDAQALAARAAAFSSAMDAAYSATPFFPLAGTPSADALTAEAASLSADLTAAGLGGLAPLLLASDRVTSDGFALLPTLAGGGIEAAPLQTRKLLHGPGDLELSARVRLLDNLTPEWTGGRTFPVDRAEARAAGPWLGYRVTASFLTRLPTGTNEDPDDLLDIARSDAQLDFEGGATATLRFGRLLGLTAGARYGIQGSTTLTKRVAAPEVVLAPLSTRREVTFDPGDYLIVGIAPQLHVTEALSLHAEYRLFRKNPDRYALLVPDAGLDVTVLEAESRVEQHQIGGGLRYDAVAPWRAGAEGYPVEVHFRVVHSYAGSGGQTPAVTRVEAGVRIFQRLWGPRGQS